MDQIRRTSSSRPAAPERARWLSRAASWAKYLSSASLPSEVTTITSSIPAAAASSTWYWIIGLSRMGRSSLGTTLEAGRNRVPSPPAGMTALRTLAGSFTGAILPPAPGMNKERRGAGQPVPSRRPVLID